MPMDSATNCVPSTLQGPSVSSVCPGDPRSQDHSCHQQAHGDQGGPNVLSLLSVQVMQ